MKIFANIPSALLTGFSDMCAPVEQISEAALSNRTFGVCTYLISPWLLKQLKIDGIDDKQLCVHLSICVEG